MADARDKLLLLAGTPPGNCLVGEIILRDLIRHYGAERVNCVAIVPAHYRAASEPIIDGLDVRLLYSGYTHGKRSSSGRWGAAAAHLRFLTRFPHEVSRLVQTIAADARAAGAQRIFAVLDNPLVMAVAHRLAAVSGLPLVSLIWDPPDYLSSLYRFDRWSRRSLLREFRASLAASSKVAVVSETMQQDYAAWTSAPIYLLRHGVAPAPDDVADRPLPQDEWVIGFAGSIYSNCAWRALLGALDSVDWQVAGRLVRLKLLTSRIEIASRRGARIEYLGFRPPEQVQGLLADCHLTYMPQPFVPHLRELCRYAFPTKLGDYLALGRPVFVHSPPDSALSAFVATHPVGAHAASLEPANIIEALESLLGSEKAYTDACRQVRETTRVHFTDVAFHAAIDQVLGGAMQSPGAGQGRMIGDQSGGLA